MTQQGAERVDFRHHEIEQGLHARDVAQVGMHQQIDVRHRFRHRVEHADQVFFHIADLQRQGPYSDAGFHAQQHADHVVAARGHDRVGHQRAKPFRGMNILQRAIEYDHGMAVEVGGAVHAAMASDIRPACIERPWRVGELPADERAVLAFAGAQGDVGLALREIEELIRDQQVDAHGRVTRVKYIEHPRDEAVRHSLRACQAHRAARGGVGRSDLAVEAGDRGFHGFGMRA